LKSCAVFAAMPLTWVRPCSLAPTNLLLKQGDH
jgi:hypothetical protein